MKVWSVVRGIGVALAVVAFAGAGGEAAVAQAPIGPRQHFAGIVNGVRGRVVVDTVCSGPAGGHRTGRVKGGQTMAVAEVAHGHGDTGPFSQIDAWFAPVRTGTKPVMLTFTGYGRSQKVPRSVRVPCNGKGEAVFSSCPYLAPCAAGFVQDRLKVKFENIAAGASRSGRYGAAEPRLETPAG